MDDRILPSGEKDPLQEAILAGKKQVANLNKPPVIKHITEAQAQSLYKRFRINIPKKFRKGKKPMEIHQLRVGLFVDWLLSQGIEIKDE